MKFLQRCLCPNRCPLPSTFTSVSFRGPQIPAGRGPGVQVGQVRDQPLATQEPARGEEGSEPGGEAGSGLGLSPRETLEGTQAGPRRLENCRAAPPARSLDEGQEETPC